MFAPAEGDGKTAEFVVTQGELLQLLKAPNRCRQLLQLCPVQLEGLELTEGPELLQKQSTKR